MSKHPMPPIAVTGLGALFPGEPTTDGFWRTIISGRDCIQDVPPGHWLLEDYYHPDPSIPGKTYARRGAFIDPVDFDPIEHGIPPNVLASTDTAQLLALIVARQLLDASCDFNRVAKERTSVILGVASATELVSTMSGSLQLPIIEKTLRASGLSDQQTAAICERVSKCYVDWTESTFPGLLGNVVAGRIANRFDLGGSNCVIDAACASSLAAIKMAIDELWTGSTDLVVTGGVDAINDIFMFMCFSKTLAMSGKGDCRPFSDSADGTMLGEGIGMFALRRLEDAERDGDTIYAVLRGMGGSSDGRAKSIYAPRPEGQARALRRAYESAGYGPATIELMEAHGTGTVAGDAAEVAALKDVFGSDRNSGTPWCALGSIKSQIGHTKAAAGAASLFKAVMALHHKVLPPTIKVDTPNPSLALDQSPFYLNTRLRPWIRSSAHPRRASVSSFGFGGSNFHLTLEEYTGAGPKPLRVRTIESELFLFSSKLENALIEEARRTASMAGDAIGFSVSAYRSQKNFDSHAPFRLGIVARDSADLLSKIDGAAQALQKGSTSFWSPAGIALGTGPSQGRTAFLFPGQGSQYPEMTLGLALAFEEARRAWDSAADVAAAVFPPPSFNASERDAQISRLTETGTAQPAIGVASQIYLDILRAAGIQPDLCAGHSFGEVTALYCAGALSTTDFLRVARQRGALMADASARIPGAMAAVMISSADFESVRHTLGNDVVVANINSPLQLVLAGPQDQIEDALTILQQRQIRTRRLPVSTAFHSPIVEPATVPFSSFLQGIDFQTPAIPVYSNTTSQAYPQTPPEIKTLLGQQLARPVRFADQITAMYDAGARLFVEVGPHSVLTDLVMACLDGKPHMAISTDVKGKDAATALWMCFARLAAHGVKFDLSFAWNHYRTTVDEKPRRSPATVSISGTNYSKKYPADIEPVALPAQALAAAPAPAPTLSLSIEAERLAAIERIQERMAEAHASAQRALTESHLAYLKSSESAIGLLLGGEAVTMPPVHQAQPQPLPPVSLPAIAPVRQPAPVIAEPAPTVTKGHAPEDLEKLVLSIIADQTGYPLDVLTADMDLEADLGIDSIKRVQILAAIAEKRPDLPAVEASGMAALRTIRSIFDHLKNIPSLAAAPSGPAPVPLRRLGLEQIEAPPTIPDKAVFGSNPNLAIVGCNDGIGVALVERLRENGVTASVSAQIPSDATSAVFLDFEDHDAEDVADHAQRIFSATRHFTSSKGAERGALIMVHARRSGWKSGIEGLARTFALEHPECSVRSIEVDRGHRSPTELAHVITDEILAAGSTAAVRVDATGRRTIRKEIEQPVRGTPSADLLKDRPVIVASGGARGVTAACLLSAAEAAPVRVALLGRTVLTPEPSETASAQDATQLKAALLAVARSRGESPSPRTLETSARQILKNREIVANLEAFRKLGSEAIYIAADATDEQAVTDALRQVRQQWGQIDMLIHGAGVLADKRIADKSPEEFARVFSAKVLGLRSLLRATEHDRLRFICLFSSVAGRYGNAGQADYAMANAALSRIAEEEAARRGSQCIVRSLNWGPWDGGMVTPELRSHFKSKGIPVISMREGATAFLRELQHRSSDPADVDVVLVPQQ